VSRSLAFLLAGSLAAVLIGFAAPVAGAVTITEFPIPTAGAGPVGIAAGPDGALWFTESNANQIGRVTTTGSFSEFPVPTAGSVPRRIAAGPDGALWFTEHSVNKIGRVTTAGSFSEFPIPTADSFPEGITAGPDGALWFTAGNANKIGRLDPTAPPPSTPDCSTSDRGMITAQNGDRATFSGRADVSASGEPSGRQTYTDRGPADPLVMRSTSIHALVCDGRDASIFGQAFVNGDGQGVQIHLHDGGPRRKDTYRIVLGGGYDSGVRSLRSGTVRVR
jgi:streptogramin lyase